MTSATFDLVVRPEVLAIARLHAGDAIPAWTAAGSGFWAILRRDDELSVVTYSSAVPSDVQAWHGMRALEVVGPFDLEAVGVLTAIAGPLAAARIWLFALATYDTDVVLVKGDQLEQAITALVHAGHCVSRRT